MIVIGLMSGTAADGIDAAVVQLSGQPPTLDWALLAHCAQPFSAELRSEILACCDPRSGTVDRLCSLNVALGEAYSGLALAAAAAAGLHPAQIDLIGSHGQTVWHAPHATPPGTLQLGEAALIAERTGAPVVHNFRPRDIAAGGQGAPLVAYVDQLLFSHPTQVRALQNIGGIGNVTYLPPNGEGAFAFDTGPGMLLIDAAASRASDGAQRFDRDGALARRGHVDRPLLAALLADEYLQLPPPKTTGREQFGVQRFEAIWQAALAAAISPIDLVATLTSFTAQSIARAYRDFLPTVPEVFVSGGGAHNATLLAALQAELAPAHVATVAQLGVPVEAKEALAFAILAYETWHHRPNNLPAATGADRRVVLGSITY